ncbi:MAG: FtsX-like permease family protein [Acidobacteriaceae bacterium]
MPRLSYGTAARIATHELHSSRGRFTFVILSVAIGVAALTGVRGFSSAFRVTLLLRARSIMAADIAARTTMPPTPDEQAGIAKLEAVGDEETPVTEMLSMASAATAMDPLLVSVKAVEPGKYPFYGAVVLEPAMALNAALTDSTVAVGDDLLLRLHLKVGDSVKLGTQTFKIAAVVEDEPDRLSGMFAAGPRVLISQKALAATGLLAPGSRVTRRYLFKLPPVKPGKALSDAEVAKLKTQLETLMPEAQITDYREANPALTKALDGATGLLSLMSLVALVLGAVGVAMAMRSHLQQRLDSIAIMKSLGAGSRQIMKIYLLQTLLLGLGGGVLGVVLGIGVQLAFPLFLAKLLHLTPQLQLEPRAIGLGLMAGLLTTLLFTLPPLLDIRNVRPILILRRNVEEADDPFATRMARKLRGSAAQLGASLLIVAGLVLLATRVSDSRQVGWTFAVGLVVSLLVLLLASALTLWLLRQFLRGTRLRLPSVLRHGLANLYRPGNPSAALLAALGLGVMQIAAVYFVQRSIVNEMHVAAAGNLPNIFLMDMSSDEVGGVRTLLAQQPTVKGTPEMIPVVSARLTAIDGESLAKRKTEHMGGPSGRRGQTLNLTWPPTTDGPPPGDTVVKGKWWTAAEAADAAQHPVVAIERGRADRMKIKPGDTITISVQDEPITATVAAEYEVDSRHAFSRADFVLPRATLAGLPAVWYGGVHCDPLETATLRRVLYEHFPTVTVIDVAATLEVIRQVMLQVIYVIQFLAAFSIFAGIVILASAIAGTRYRRIREVVVLKTLGATRPRIASIFSIEFAVLGLIAGAVGLVFANLLARTLLLHALHFAYVFQPGLNAAAWLAVGAMTVLAGWLASHRVLGQKPLEVLREE